MKKSTLLIIIAAAIGLILFVNFLYHYSYFKSFSENARELTSEEKQKITEILNRSVDVSAYEVEYGKVNVVGKYEFAHVKLAKGEEKERYLINLNNEKVIKR